MMFTPAIPSFSQKPASFVFSGAGAGVGQVLSRVNSTSSPNTKTMTFSCWAKADTYKQFSVPNNEDAFFLFWDAVDANNLENIYLTSKANFAVNAVGFKSGGFTYDEHGNTSSSTSWRHIVTRFDISNSTAASRIRIYENGSLITALAVVRNPNTSEVLLFLNNGSALNIGSEAYSDGRIAFPELVVGQSLGPDSFAFNDGGTWTAKKYTGSYGTYGFRLDGTGGASGCNDVSGNGMHFTPTNWNVSNNLDYSELPPRNF